MNEFSVPIILFFFYFFHPFTHSWQCCHLSLPVPSLAGQNTTCHANKCVPNLVAATRNCLPHPHPQSTLTSLSIIHLYAFIALGWGRNAQYICMNMCANYLHVPADDWRDWFGGEKPHCCSCKVRAKAHLCPIDHSGNYCNDCWHQQTCAKKSTYAKFAILPNFRLIRRVIFNLLLFASPL